MLFACRRSWIVGLVGLAYGYTLPGLAQSQRFLPGDLDGDGQVTAADVSLLSQYLQGSHSLTDRQITAADVNGDGQINGSDLQRIQQSIQAAAQKPNSQLRLDSAYSGQVIDRRTGQPLGNVEVAIPGAGITTRTDPQGRFQLPNDVPANQILVAKLENYLPSSQTTSTQSQPLQLQLDRWDRNTALILQTDVVHLGDDHFSAQSAGANQFRLRSQGTELTRSFQLNRIPSQSPLLRIGSLIGLDTPEAARAGQTLIAEADMSPLVVQLNGQEIQRIPISGNDLRIPLPLSFLQVGLNTLTLQTGKTNHPSIAQQGGGGIPIAIPFLGGLVSINIPTGNQMGGNLLDYDDIELANVVVDLPAN